MSLDGKTYAEARARAVQDIHGCDDHGEVRAHHCVNRGVLDPGAGVNQDQAGAHQIRELLLQVEHLLQRPGLPLPVFPRDLPHGVEFHVREAHPERATASEALAEVHHDLSELGLAIDVVVHVSVGAFLCLEYRGEAGGPEVEIEERHVEPPGGEDGGEVAGDEALPGAPPAGVDRYHPGHFIHRPL